MPIRKSAEDYLETILLLGDHVHAVAIASKLAISKAAVTKALKGLAESGMVIKTDQHIILTEKGRKYAERVYKKHRLLTEFWIRLGVSAETAEHDACQTEHILSEETLDAIDKFVKK